MKNERGDSEPKVRQVFLAALDIADAGERKAFLAHACKDDPALLQQVNELLFRHQDDSFLEKPAIQEESTATVVTPAGQSQPKPLELPVNLRYFGDYELMEEVARGGMGVVFKARQKSLNRIVAVKMIRGGSLASDSDVKRFRAEAEAAANLQHPNIVAIHEVGDHEGQHYFSMDLVEGPTLAEVVKTEPLPTGKAAHYVKAIAEAVQYAHQRGILHRDLKPSNVLLDAQERVRVTDFGLAKVMHRDSDLTRSGDVMGSPAYMAPEQAQAKQKLIGPPSDVYSLGALLYHLITGRPPFSGETMLETLHQMLEEEPERPSKLNSKVPADLETICLKCLSKAPEQRYATASALAEELDRFLNYEPILAKAASPWRRLWHWTQKNPWVLAGGFARLVVLFACTAYGFYERTRYLEWHSQTKIHVEAEWKNAPVVLFAKLLPLLVVLVVLTRSMLARGHKPEQERTLAGEMALFTYGVGGVVATLLGTGAILWQIHSWAWRMQSPSLFGWELAGMLLAWIVVVMGCQSLWHVAGLQESSKYRDKVMTELDRHSGRTQKAVGLGKRFLRSCLFILWLLVVSILVLSTVAVSIGYGNPRTWVTMPILTAATILVARHVGVAFRERKRLLHHVFLPSGIWAFLILLAGGFQIFKETDPEDRLIMPILMGLLFGCFSFKPAFLPARNVPRVSRSFPVPFWKDALLALLILTFTLGALVLEENWRARRSFQSAQEGLVAIKPITEPKPQEAIFWTEPFISSRILRQTTRANPMEPLPPHVPYYSRKWRVPKKDVTPLPWLLIDRMSHEPELEGTPGLLPVEAVIPANMLPSHTGSEEAKPAKSFTLELNDVHPVEALVEGLRKAGVSGKIDDASVIALSNPTERTDVKINNTPTDQAIAALREFSGVELDAERWKREKVIAFKRGEYNVSRAELHEWYQQYDEDFRQLERALAAPKAALPANLDQILDRNVFSPSATKTSESITSQIDALVLTLSNRSLIQLSFGDTQSALHGFKILRQLADQLASSEAPSYTGTRHRQAILKLLATHVQDTLATNPQVWSDKSLEELQHMVDASKELALMKRSFESRIAPVVLGEIERRRTQSHEYPALALDFYPFFRNLAGGEIRDRFLGVFLFDGCFHQNAAAWLKSHRRLLDGVNERGSRLESDQITQAETAFRSIRNGFLPYVAIAGLPALDFFPDIKEAAKVQTLVDMAYLACGLQRFRNDQGRYPDRLEELQPNYASRIPHDIFDGKPLRYQRAAKGKYSLYSIGWNFNDDGGKSSSPENQVKEQWKDDSHDWVWQGVPKK